MPARAARTAELWLAPDQLALVRAVLDRLSEGSQTPIRVQRAGCPDAAARAELARALDAQPLDDLRAALTATDADLFLIADPGDFGARAAHDDARVIRAAIERGTRVASFEPTPASLIELAAALAAGERPLSAGPRAEWARLVPISRWTTHVREALELLESFGPVRAASIHSLSTPAHGSLGARLLDTMDLVLALLGTPESIDAHFTPATRGQTLRSEPGETLRDLHGDLSANLRFASGQSASLLISNHAGAWDRTCTLLGRGGRLRVFADGFEWVDPSGERLDASRTKKTARGSSSGVSPFVAAAADQLEQLLAAGPAAPGLPDYAGALALSQAALLSARTGEPESPATILRMAGAT